MHALAVEDRPERIVPDEHRSARQRRTTQHDLEDSQPEFRHADDEERDDEERTPHCHEEPRHAESCHDDHGLIDTRDAIVSPCDNG